jgi:hypothetical protein
MHKETKTYALTDDDLLRLFKSVEALSYDRLNGIWHPEENHSIVTDGKIMVIDKSGRLYRPEFLGKRANWYGKKLDTINLPYKHLIPNAESMEHIQLNFSDFIPYRSRRGLLDFGSFQKIFIDIKTGAPVLVAGDNENLIQFNSVYLEMIQFNKQVDLYFENARKSVCFELNEDPTLQIVLMPMSGGTYKADEKGNGFALHVYPGNTGIR